MQIMYCDYENYSRQTKTKESHYCCLNLIHGAPDSSVGKSVELEVRGSNLGIGNLVVRSDLI